MKLCLFCKLLKLKKEKWTQERNFVYIFRQFSSLLVDFLWGFLLLFRTTLWLLLAHWSRQELTIKVVWCRRCRCSCVKKNLGPTSRHAWHFSRQCCQNNMLFSAMSSRHNLISVIIIIFINVISYRKTCWMICHPNFFFEKLKNLDFVKKNAFYMSF